MKNIKLGGKIRTTTVMGKTYEVQSCMIARATFARDVETDEEKKISSGSYLSNDLSIRKAIALTFNLPSFRKV